MKQKLIYVTTLFVVFNLSSYAQFGKLKGMMGKKDTTKTEEPKKEGGLMGGGFMNKVVGKFAKTALTLGGSSLGFVGSTSDLNTVEPSPTFNANLHSEAVQEIGQTFFNGWETGGSQILVGFSSREKFQFTKIEGDVKFNGQPANYTSLGYYSGFYKDNNPAQVEIKTNSGQSSSFTLTAPKHKVKIISINGQTDDIKLDLSKDVTLLLEPMTADTSTPITVYLCGGVIGTKSFYTVGVFNPKSKIVIPAVMFRNMGADNRVNFANSYIQLSRMKIENATNVSGLYKDVTYNSVTNDGKFITTVNKPAINEKLVAKGTVGSTEFEIEKNKAVFSQNFAALKNIGVLAFAANGTTSGSDSKSGYDMKLGGSGGFETNTVTAKFPQFSSEVWNNVLDHFYQDITKVLSEEFGAKVIPLEKITSSDGYKGIASYSVPEANTKDEFSVSYKNTKQMIGMRPITSMVGKKSPDYKIMQETGADGLLVLTLHFDMKVKYPHADMIPRLTFSIGGTQLGELAATSFLSGSVTGSPYGISNKTSMDANKLENIALNRTALVAAFRKGIQDIKAKEKANGDYEAEWAAMNQ